MLVYCPVICSQGVLLKETLGTKFINIGRTKINQLLPTGNKYSKQQIITFHSVRNQLRREKKTEEEEEKEEGLSEKILSKSILHSRLDGVKNKTNPPKTSSSSTPPPSSSSSSPILSSPSPSPSTAISRKSKKVTKKEIKEKIIFNVKSEVENERGDSNVIDAVASKKENLRNGESENKMEQNVVEVEDQYQKMSAIEHILLRPDTYVGSIQLTSQSLFVYNIESMKMERKTVTYVPALYKIFDEILVNAADNKQRDKSMSVIKVNIDTKNNKITVYNNGKGIPIHEHAKEKIYIPELIFGNLLTSSNFNDKVQKITGGRNGFGAKLTNIFSSTFEVETANNGRVYYQKWENNMNTLHPPIITQQLQSSSPNDLTTKRKRTDHRNDYTQISFQPDLTKFGMTSLEADDDILQLLYTRVVDIAGCCDGSIHVYLNDVLLPPSFESYVSLFFENSIHKLASSDEENNSSPSPLEANRKIEDANEDVEEDEDERDDNGGSVTEDREKTWRPIIFSVGDRWKIGLGLSNNNKFQQISFVNNINTIHGGTHVNYIIDQITEKISSKIAKIDKQLEVVSAHVKQNLFIFVNSLIENPTFSSQTKEVLTSKIKDFGSECVIPDRIIKQFMIDTPIVDRVLRFVKLKQTYDLNKTQSGGGNTKKKYLAISKLEDAEWAGTSKSAECTLILTEGDSAKAFAISGLSILGRARFGVFPLKGKLLNVREAKIQQITENEEISNIIKILGLNYSKKYNDQEEDGIQQLRTLRYGKVMLMTDQDPDGSHIKGLFINFLHYYWPNLLKQNFLEEFITPIVKVTLPSHQSKKEQLSFFTLPEYNLWKQQYEQSHRSLSSVKVKYYKGLGTNTSEEGREYFKNLPKHRKQLSWDDRASASIDLAFNKSKAADRKQWIQSTYTSSLYLDYSTSSSISYSDFIDKELILFSYADVIRSIPSIVDGLKPSQRKILFASLKKRNPSLLSQEIKVSQLAGYVSEVSSYHHGDVSLATSIISMAQNYVGSSNNIPLLLPIGQFGTRLSSGADHASPRYIYTKLNPLTREIFKEEDDEILHYLNDDGISIEPEYYVPIIPMILVNGASGIGTGWATNIPSFNPLELIENMNNLLENKKMKEMKPFYNSFQGDIIKNQENYLVRGKYSIETDKKGTPFIQISELPIKRSTTSYKEFLDNLMTKKVTKRDSFQLQKYISHYTDEKVDFKLVVDAAILEGIKDDINSDGKSMYDLLNLESSISMNNMHLFDANNKIKKYNYVEEIMEEFFEVRLGFYEKRKTFMSKRMHTQLHNLQLKFQFIQKVLNNEIKLFSRPKSAVLSDIHQSLLKTQQKYTLNVENSEEFVEHLLNLPIQTFTSEKLAKISEELKNLSDDYNSLLSSSVSSLWSRDLSLLHHSVLQTLTKPSIVVPHSTPKRSKREG